MSHTPTTEELDRLDRLFWEWQSTLTELEDEQAELANRISQKKIWVARDYDRYKTYGEAINADIEPERIAS